jgi:hypothetical protein
MTAKDDAIDDLSNALLVYGIHVGFGEKRSAAAHDLYQQGVTVDDLELVGDHCTDTTDSAGASAKVMFSLLGEPKRFEAKLEDLRKQKELQKARVVAPNADSRKPIGPIEGEDPERWESERRCRMAHCMLHGDRWAIERVARELEVTVAEAQEMADQGKAICRSPIIDGQSSISPKEAEKARKQEQARSTDFRQRMRDDAVRAKTGRRVLGIDWKQIAWHKNNILATLREKGILDVSACLRDKNRSGALAELEALGEILRDGPLSEDQQQAYKVANNDDDRKRFHDQFIMWNEDDMRLYNHRKAMEKGYDFN